MKYAVVLAALFACIVSGARAADEGPKEAPKAAQSKEHDSMAIGLLIGGNLKETAEDIDLENVIKGIREAFSDKQSMTQAEIQSTVQNFQQQMMERQQARMKKKGEEAEKLGEDFLTANKAKEGIQSTASGLQYKVIAEGKGDKPKATDTAVVQYKGALIDGTVFDSSEKHGGKPVSFPINRVIPGWTEGLQLMTPGAKYQFFIPAKLAYGPNPPPGSNIPPNSVLVFDVELVSVTPAGPGAGNGMGNGMK